MKKFIITKISEYGELTLIDERQNKFNVIIEFHDVTPKIGSIITFSEKLLDRSYPDYSGMYSFGLLDSPYGRANVDRDSDEAATLKVDDKLILLKRLYG